MSALSLESLTILPGATGRCKICKIVQKCAKCIKINDYANCTNHHLSRLSCVVLYYSFSVQMGAMGCNMGGPGSTLHDLRRFSAFFLHFSAAEFLLFSVSCSVFSECIDQGEGPYAEGPVATNVRPFKISIDQGESTGKAHMQRFIIEESSQRAPPFFVDGGSIN